MSFRRRPTTMSDSISIFGCYLVAFQLQVIDENIFDDIFISHNKLHCELENDNFPCRHTLTITSKYS